jgi:hypothetical protein
VSTSEIIDKADEIKEFGEYEDVELQFFLFGLIPIIGKIITVGAGIFAKAKAFIAGTKIFKFAQGAFRAGRGIFKGAQTLFHKSKIFTTGQRIFNKGRQIYKKFKGVFERSKLFKKGSEVYNKYKTMLEKNKIYQTYKKIKHIYEQGKDVYKEITDYYNKEKGLDDREHEQNPQQNQGFLGGQGGGRFR